VNRKLNGCIIVVFVAGLLASGVFLLDGASHPARKPAMHHDAGTPDAG